MSEQKTISGNSHRPRSWEVSIDSEFRVLVDGTPLADPPNRTVATLLLALMHVAPNPLTRTEIARRLHGGKDGVSGNNALRQSLFRLRAWLGPELCSVDKDRVGLVGDEFRFNAEPIDGRGNRGFFPDLDHPWVEEFRRHHRLQSGQSDPTDPMTRWAEVIRDVAQSDLDAARGLLVGGPGFIDRLDVGLATELFELTRPRIQTDSWSWEHSMLYGEKLSHSNRFAEGLAHIAEGARIAHRLDNPFLFERSTLSYAGWLIEIGNVAGAGRRLARLKESRHSFNALDRANSLACYHWNLTHWELARAEFQKGMKLLDRSSAVQQQHFLRNYAYFAAELGLTQEFEESSSACAGLVAGPTAKHMLFVLDCARAIHRAREVDLYDGLEQISLLIESDFASVQSCQQLYLHEAAATIESRLGNATSARNRWRKAEQMRTEHGGRLTPRLQAMREAVFY